jgi:hypothetical protein
MTMKSLLVTNDSATARKLTGLVQSKADYVIEEAEGGTDGMEELSASEASVGIFLHELTRPEVLICETESLLGGGPR